VLGLVVGPGCVLGVGLVVLGVSVPMPPAFEPELDAPPEVPDEESEGMPEEVPPVLLPLLSEGVVGAFPDRPPVLIPELLPEPSPVMPVHAPNSIAHTMGNNDFVMKHSRLDKKEARTRCAPENASRMQEVETTGGGKFATSRQRLTSRKLA
jgi:hypothetical protein